jgi:hypothetical protein
LHEKLRIAEEIIGTCQLWVCVVLRVCVFKFTIVIAVSVCIVTVVGVSLVYMCSFSVWRACVPNRCSTLSENMDQMLKTGSSDGDKKKTEKSKYAKRSSTKF